MKPLLEVKNLKKYFESTTGFIKKETNYVYAVEDVSFSINPRETYGLVGESGCGKTTTGKCVSRLIEATGGEVYFDGDNLFELDKEEMRKRRENIQMIYQDPYGSLNPRMTVYDLFKEPLITHGINKKSDIKEKVNDMAERIGLSKEQLDRYPHQFSGGQRQRISIGRALMIHPKLIIADEPVSALDVSIQSQILNLLMELEEELGLTMMFISHDLNVVRHISKNIGVMYLGEIVEQGDTESVYQNPVHPYTQALLESIPVTDPLLKKERKLLEGDVLNPIDKPSGCPFSSRCPRVMDICKVEKPMEKEVHKGHFASCHLL